MTISCFARAVISLIFFTSIARAGPIKLNSDVGANWGIRAAGEITDSPFIAQIRLAANKSLICSGAIFNYLYILTTASCVDGYAPEELFVVVGLTDSNDGTSYYLDEIKPHEEYSKNGISHSNDIAMLKLARYLKYNDKVRPIRVPETWESGLEVEEGSTVIVNAWTAYQRLRRFLQTVSSIAYCRMSYSALNLPISEFLICAIAKPTQNNEHGNSGSALVHDSKLIGLMSWFVDGHPDVYTRVSLFARWIDEHNLE